MYAHPCFFLEGDLVVLHVVPHDSELLKRVQVDRSMQMALDATRQQQSGD